MSYKFSFARALVANQPAGIYTVEETCEKRRVWWVLRWTHDYQTTLCDKTITVTSIKHQQRH